MSNFTDQDKAVLKELVREVISEDKDLMRDIAARYVKMYPEEAFSLNEIREEQLKKLILKDFNRFDDVFKALA